MSDELMSSIGAEGTVNTDHMAPVCPNGQSYTVKPGDTMFFIARHFNISLQSLITANPQITDPNTIFPGQMICVPVSGPGPLPCPNGMMYMVMAGDTMFEIARRNGISLSALIAANPQINNPNMIFPGQVICIPSVGPGPGPGPLPCPNGMMYTVMAGDTMFEIARRNGISLDTLIAANPQITDPNMIFPGQVICLPMPPVVPCPGGTLYTIVSGDTMFEIAKRYNISLTALIAANPQIANPNRIFPGQVLCIPAAVVPMPLPMPMPLPTPIEPITMPPMPMPMPCPQLCPQPYPMPVYVVVPWDECPYRNKKKKRGRHDKCCH